MVVDSIALVITLALTGAAAWFLGGYIAALVSGRIPRVMRPVRAIERAAYRLTGIDEEQEQSWIRYKLVALSVLVMPACVLGFTAVSALASRGQAGPSNPGPHGFTEILYGFSSAPANNGSAFAGLNGNTLFYNTTLAAAMWIGRILVALPALALAGSLARKPTVPPSGGTFPTDTPLFTVLLVGAITIVVGLIFLPADALGPLLEQFSR